MDLTIFTYKMNYNNYHMKRLTLVLLSLIFAFSTKSQQFENISAGLSNLKESCVAWGDFDNDGDADFIACGLKSNNSPATLLYINEEGSFSETNPGIVAVSGGSLDWGDHDMDGDLDLLVTGLSLSGPFTAIYNNDNGVFTQTTDPLVNVMGGEGTWGDFDNDGDLDFFITGNMNSILYENREGSFVESPYVFPDMQSSSVAFGDYDNDGDLDVFLMGDTGAGMFSYLYENTDGDFILNYNNFNGLFAGTVCWVDYDNDGDLDLNISGLDMYLESNYHIYSNNGNGMFTLEFPNVNDISSSTSEWADMDNDGDLDVYVAGKLNSCGAYFSGIYKNEGGTLLFHSGVFPDSYNGSAAWVDYDNDGDNDILITGESSSGSSFTTLYRNNDHSNTFVYNTKPLAPANLQANVTDNIVEFSWEHGSDNETSQEGLSYNIRIGFTPSSQEILSSMSDEDGQRLISDIGNVGQGTNWTIKHFGIGTYYCSVQTIDQCGNGSDFSTTESFTILNTGTIENDPSSDNIRILQNPAINKLDFSYGKDNQHIAVRIINPSGKTHIQKQLSGDKHTLNIERLSSGFYILQINDAGKVVSRKFLVK